MGSHFSSASGCVIDRDGNRSEQFVSVIHEVGADSQGNAIAADMVATVVDVCKELDITQLHNSYRRIAQAKSLRKSPAGPGQTRTTVTLGILLALRSRISLEVIGQELERLNAATPSNQWPDMIAVAPTGVINFAVQFPGDKLSGDLLPPAEGALAKYSPPIYVVPVMRPTGAYTFNKMLAYLVAHLCIFHPGAPLPEWNAMLEGVSQNVVTLSGYQYNPRGDLLPVPREFHNDRYFPPPPLRVEDGSGEVLATIQFLPWQDGGVILLRGKLPLDGLLIFLGREKLQRSGVVKLEHAQISYVLPITQADFRDFLQRFQRQSNMHIRSDPGRFVIQKIADEGSSSPFMARLFLGILKLRDAVYPDPTTREEFDRLHDYMTTAITSVRSSSQTIVQQWSEHARKVTSEEVARQHGNQIRVDESIDKEMRREIETFLNAATRALKTGVQNLGRHLGVDIGFLFQKQASFDRGIAALKATDPDLAAYLQQTRRWSEPLMECRIALEHGTWVLPRTSYEPDGTGVRAAEPLVSGEPITQFVNNSYDRLICFAEDFVSHCLQRALPTGITITEIPLADRPRELPERFRVTLAAGGLPSWRIASHSSLFEDT